MTYFSFLAQFLIIPIIGLILLNWYDLRRGLARPMELQGWPAGRVLLAHILIALIYTTPWDNYLVATRVWFYNPDLISGLILGWVPIEEYTFFVLQPLLTGLWLLYLARRLPINLQPSNGQLRWRVLPALGLLWLLMIVILLLKWQPATYLALILVWALPPIMLQIAFGADILWQHRQLVLLSLLPATLYLSLADALAIGVGTWAIDPAQSLQLYLGGILPLEEFIFFLVTNILLTFGILLALTFESRRRFSRYLGNRPARLSGLSFTDNKEQIKRM